MLLKMYNGTNHLILDTASGTQYTKSTDGFGNIVVITGLDGNVQQFNDDSGYNNWAHLEANAT